MAGMKVLESLILIFFYLLTTTLTIYLRNRGIIVLGILQIID